MSQQSCPTAFPFWADHPHCLFCNWDDDQDRDASAFTASVAGETGQAPVAWLCAECADSDAIRVWFFATVLSAYPVATISG